MRRHGPVLASFVKAADMSTRLLPRFLATLGALTIAGTAFAAAPVASFSAASFTEYLGATPTTVQQDGSVLWFQESQGQSFDTGNGSILVDSWFVVFDPRARPASVSGSITFGSNIVAIQDTRAALLATAALQKSGSSYNYVPGIGLEDEDRAATSFAGQTLSIGRWTASNPGDHVRVLTVSTVPENSSGALLLAGLGVIGLLARRRW